MTSGIIFDCISRSAKRRMSASVNVAVEVVGSIAAERTSDTKVSVVYWLKVYPSWMRGDSTAVSEAIRRADAVTLAVRRRERTTSGIPSIPGMSNGISAGIWPT